MNKYKLFMYSDSLNAYKSYRKILKYINMMKEQSHPLLVDISSVTFTVEETFTKRYKNADITVHWIFMEFSDEQQALMFQLKYKGMQDFRHALADAVDDVLTASWSSYE